MFIELARVGSTPKPVEASFSTEGFDLDDEARLMGDVKLAGSVFSDERGVHLKGQVAALIEMDCVRCLTPVAKDLALSFEDVFVDASLEKRDDDDEAEIEIDELDESLVEDGKVDLLEVVREQILLALPDQPLCKEDCKGLCPKCGVNRNLIDCSCSENVIDPRWAALKNLN